MEEEQLKYHQASSGLDGPRGAASSAQKSQMSAATESETAFAPQINPKSKEIVRDRAVQDILYEDAIRRKQATQIKQQKREIEEKVAAKGLANPQKKSAKEQSEKYVQ